MSESVKPKILIDAAEIKPAAIFRIDRGKTGKITDHTGGSITAELPRAWEVLLFITKIV